MNYVWFDFHSECKKMKYENLSKLIAIVQEDMRSHKHFSATLSTVDGS